MESLDSTGGFHLAEKLEKLKQLSPDKSKASPYVCFFLRKINQPFKKVVSNDVMAIHLSKFQNLWQELEPTVEHLSLSVTFANISFSHLDILANSSLATTHITSNEDYKSKTSETTADLAEALRNIKQLSTQSFGQSRDRVDVISGKKTYSIFRSLVYLQFWG